MRWYRSPLMLVFLFFALYYRWTVQPHLTVPVQEHSRYNMLADAFLAGQASLLTKPDPALLQLPDPYDPYQNWKYKLHDMSLYKGRYYVYFGPAPAITLLIPFRLIARSVLPDRIALWVFATGAFIAASLLLNVLIRRFFPSTPRWLFYSLCFFLGFANTFPFLLRRPDFYEIAIGSGQCFLLAGLYCFAKGTFEQPENRRWWWIAGTMLGFAMLSRPPLVFGALATAWLVLNPRWRNCVRSLLLPAAIPLCTAVALFAIYNYVRFDSPFEFGLHYQLAGFNQTKVTLFDLSRVKGDAYLFLIYHPNVTARFPFVFLKHPNIFPGSVFLFFEDVGGLLQFSPLLYAILLTPWIIYRQQRPRMPLAIVIGTLLAIAALLFVVDASMGATMRYEADFASLLYVAAALIIAGAWNEIRNRPLRIALLAITAIFALKTVAYMAAIGLQGYYDGLQVTAPEQFQALANFFEPVAKILRLLEPSTPGS